MQSLGKYWPLYISPLENELFSSWLVRIAHSYVTPVRLFWKNALPQILFINHQEADYSYNTNALKELSLKTRIPLYRIRETLLPGLPDNYFFQRPDWISPLGQGQTTDRKFGMCFCPLCLKEDGMSPYFRKTWRLSMVFLCPDHQIYLHDSCPKCYSPIRPFKVKLRADDKEYYNRIARCFKCDYPLIKSKARQADNLHIKIQKGFDLGEFVNSHTSLHELIHGYKSLKEISEMIWKFFRSENLSDRKEPGRMNYLDIRPFRNISRVTLASRPKIFEYISQIIPHFLLSGSKSNPVSFSNTQRFY